MRHQTSSGASGAYLYLGARGRASASEPVRHLNRLVRPSGWACSHAVAYSERVYDRLLAAIPDTVDGVTQWLATERRLDQYLAEHLEGEALAILPPLTTEVSSLGQVDETLRGRYL